MKKRGPKRWQGCGKPKKRLYSISASLTTFSELRSCVKVEVAVPGSRPLTVLYGLCGRKATLNMNNVFTCRVSIRCHVWPWLIEFSHVVSSCFTISRLTIFPEVSLLKPEDSFSPLFKAILYSVTKWDRKLVPQGTLKY